MFEVTMRQPETGETVIVEVQAVSQFHARDEATKALPFHGVVHVQQVRS
jgi:hypothetical protein